jgi:hypothetical protein
MMHESMKKSMKGDRHEYTKMTGTEHRKKYVRSQKTIILKRYPPSRSFSQSIYTPALPQRLGEFP